MIPTMEKRQVSAQLSFIHPLPNFYTDSQNYRYRGQGNQCKLHSKFCQKKKKQNEIKKKKKKHTKKPSSEISYIC